jgi:hypothetical protein
MQGETAYAVGDWDRALDHLDAFFGRADLPQPHYMDVLVRLTRGYMLYIRGDEQPLADADATVAEGRRAVTPQSYVVFQVAALFFVDAGRRAEAAELLTLGISRKVTYHFALDGAFAMAELGRGAELAELATRLDISESWLAIIRALAAEDFGTAANLYGDLGLRTYEARARLRFAERLYDEGDRAAAAEQARLALAFYEPVGAKRLIERLEAVLPVSA